MSSESTFPALTNWEPTHKTLHLYSAAIGVVPRAHAEFHPKWWHISLKVQPDGLITDSMSLPNGGAFSLMMNLRKHAVILSTSMGEEREFSMTEGLTATAFGDQLLGAVADLGLTAEYARNKFENDEDREYDPAVAEKFLSAVVNADRIFKKHRANLSGEMSPVQLWPHGFDLSFEWFGTRVVEYEEEGKITKYPSQLNLGFSPGEPSHPQPYFYSNPWPFEKDVLLETSLPEGARWHTEGWEGSIFPYAELAGDSNAAERLSAYARAVHEASAPTLTA
ncbi:MAG: hypothetical protein IH859_09945 [Chloroflexi bacterium]|nr:hypothetical protein [Chloroflexota bacterium]